VRDTFLCLQAIITSDMKNENKRILIIALLTIQSSYLEEMEKPAGDIPDTVQFWLLPESAWRIKTFAVDHDIHVHNIAKLPKFSENCIDFFVSNIEKSYGDVIAAMHIIHFENYTDTDSVQSRLKENGLNPNLEVAPAGFAFYNPDSGHYRTKSQPK
jgi:hypothetical protein